MGFGTASTSADEFIPQNLLRKSILIQNEDASIDMFVKAEQPQFTTVSSSDHDHRISPGGSLELNALSDGIQQIRERWTIVSASGTPSFSFLETEDVRR